MQHANQFVSVVVAKDATILFFKFDSELVLHKYLGSHIVIATGLKILDKLFRESFLLSHMLRVHDEHHHTDWYYPFLV